MVHGVNDFKETANGRRFATYIAESTMATECRRWWGMGGGYDDDPSVRNVGVMTLRRSSFAGGKRLVRDETVDFACGALGGKR
jgi:hypothetical protein